MGLLYRIENRVAGGLRSMASRWTRVGVEALTDYHRRELDHEAASVSFYAIFSLFPLMAFLVFVVAELTGSPSANDTAPVVLAILKQLMPNVDGWIEQGVLEILRLNAVDNWLNAILLAWSGMRFFSALLTALSSTPDTDAARAKAASRSKAVRTLLAGVTLLLSSVLVVTLVICDFLARSPKIPPWLQGLPYAYQDLIYLGGRTGVLLSLVSVATIAALFKVVLPCRLSLRAAVSGAALCSALLVLSRSAYWIYLHYQGSQIQSNYGAFSALVINMLWIHFVVNCVLYCCLFALQLDRDRAMRPLEATAGPAEPPARRIAS
jgi:membrane protein